MELTRLYKYLTAYNSPYYYGVARSDVRDNHNHNYDLQRARVLPNCVSHFEDSLSPLLQTLK